MPQPEVDYGLYWRGHNLAVVSRRDGILVQAQGDHDFGNDDVASTKDRTGYRCGDPHIRTRGQFCICSLITIGQNISYLTQRTIAYRRQTGD